MRTTINISEDILREAEAFYKTENMSKAIECALRDAIRFKKRQMLQDLKGKLEFDEEAVLRLRSMENEEA